MQRRKIVKKNEPRAIKQPACRNATGGSMNWHGNTIRDTRLEKLIGDNSKFPVVLYFFNRPRLYKAFTGIAEEKGIPLRKLIMSFAALGLKAYLKNTGQAFKEDAI